MVANPAEFLMLSRWILRGVPLFGKLLLLLKGCRVVGHRVLREKHVRSQGLGMAVWAA